MTEKKQSNTFEKIYAVVREIPRGSVATYGQVAALAGNKRWGHAVGFAMSSCRDETVPCYRVVNRFGEVSAAFDSGEGNRQILLLEADGIPCAGGRVDLKQYQWKRVTDTYME